MLHKTFKICHLMKHVCLIILVLCLFVSSCGNPGQQQNHAESYQPESVDAKNRSIYHWKTTFDLTQEDEAFIQQHNIKTIYLRMFDVGMDTDNGVETGEIVPLGTTKFISKIPKGCSYVPTVYITLKALKEYDMRESELADLIIRRIMAMCSWNELGCFHEIQYDCDWTAETRASFERLCSHTRKVLKEYDVILSGTIRLHQIEEATYPFDKGVLMIYNTGSFKNPNIENSILDYDDVYKYLSVEKRIQRFLQAREENCPVMEVAYPTYGWGVVFDENRKFDRLVSKPEEHRLDEGETIRPEMGTYSEIMKVKRLVDSTIAPTCSGHILYHLDSENLNRYKSHEIEDIYN